MDTTFKSIQYGPEKIAIFDWFKTSLVHGKPYKSLVVRARAGTGKSTAIRKGVGLAPEKDKLIAAFSKNIQLDMVKAYEAMGEIVPAVIQTLHAVGYACIRQFRTGIRVDFKSTRADALAWDVCGTNAPDTIVKLVSKLHTKGREIAPFAKDLGDLSALQVTFECLPGEEWTTTSYTAEYVERKALEAMERAAVIGNSTTIDGADMIYLPIRNGWLTPKYDLVCVDEAQDMTVAQLLIAQGVLRDGGRICIVGDDRQAIFAFRGADSGSLDRLKGELGAAELGLTTTYRCGKAIVEEAKRLVPDFEAGEENGEGLVRNLAENENLIEALKPGDFFLSRVNAPLVGVAMKLLRSGKRARVAGRDIGYGLTALLRKLKARSVPELLTRLEGWAAREMHRHEVALAAAAKNRKAALEAKIEAIQDQADMLTNLADGAKSVTEVIERVEALFTDDGLGDKGLVTCSSVHRAKGLEADRVFVARETLRVDTIEEENIKYVAITRAKHELIWVSNGAL